MPLSSVRLRQFVDRSFARYGQTINSSQFIIIIIIITIIMYYYC